MALCILLIGPPCSGKTTLGTHLAKKLNLPHIVASTLFKDHAFAAADMSQLQSLQSDVIAARLCQPDCLRGFILDNFPKTHAQAQALDSFLLQKKGGKISHVLEFEVPVKLLESRAATRLVDPWGMPVLEARTEEGDTFIEDGDIVIDASVQGSPEIQEQLRAAELHLVERRSDDAPERFEKRLQRYTQEISALRVHYGAGLCKPINGVADVEAVQGQALFLLNRPDEEGSTLPTHEVHPESSYLLFDVPGLLFLVYQHHVELTTRLSSLETELKGKESWAEHVYKEPCGCVTRTKKYTGRAVPGPQCHTDAVDALDKCKTMLWQARLRHARHTVSQECGGPVFSLCYACCCPSTGDVEQLERKYRSVCQQLDALRSRRTQLDSMTATQTHKSACSEHTVPTPIGSP